MSESTAGFRQLVVWQKAQALAVLVIQTLQALPTERSADIRGTQLVRSAGSVCANVAEGYGRFSIGAYRNHLSIARGSLFETESWIDLLHKSGYFTAEDTRKLLRQSDEVGRLLTAMMKDMPESRSSRLGEEPGLYEANN